MFLKNAINKLIELFEYGFCNGGGILRLEESPSCPGSNTNMLCLYYPDDDIESGKEMRESKPIMIIDEIPSGLGGCGGIKFYGKILNNVGFDSDLSAEVLNVLYRYL